MLLGLVTFASFIPAFALPVLASRRADQRWLLAATVGLAVAGLSGLAAAPGAAVAWVVLVGAGQGAALGLALILPVLRAADPAHAAPLIAMAQCIGYTLAATGPWLLGLVHDLTGNWSAPLYVLLAITALELPAGLVGARARRRRSAREAPLSRTA